MNKYILLILLVIASHQVGCTLYFLHIGQLNPSPSYGHVHFVVDTQIITKQLSTLQIAIAYIRKSVHTISHRHVEQRANNFLLKAHLDIDNMIKEFRDLCQIVYAPLQDRTRVRRFLELLLAIGSITMSLFNQAEILHLQGQMSDVVTRQNHIVDILQEHEVSIHTLQHDVMQIRDGFISLANIVDESSAITKIHDAEIMIVMALAELRRTMVCIQNGMQQLLNHRIPICFLNTTQIEISLNNLFRSAAAHNLEPVSPHLSAFLQYDTSFLMINGKMNIYVHVPLVNRKRLLDLLRFSNAPAQISASMALKLSPPGDILAIGHEGIHCTRTSSEIHLMRRYGNIIFSDNAISLNLHLNSSCLGSIYSQDYINIKTICPAQFMNVAEQLTNIAPGEYIFYTGQPQTIQIQCQTTTTHLAIQHSEKITLGDNCEVRSKHFVTRTGHDLSAESAINKWPATWNVSGLLFNLNSPRLLQLIDNLKLTKYPVMPIRDLHQLINEGTHQNWHLVLTIVTGIAATLVIAIFGYLGYRYYRLTHNNTNTTTQTSLDN